MYIEAALDPNTTEDKKRSIKMHIHAGLISLKEGGEHWINTRWTLRMFEAIVARTALTLTSPGPGQTSEPQFNVTSMIPFSETNYDWFDTNSHSNDDTPDLLVDLDAAGNIGTLDGDLGNMSGKSAEEWMQEFLRAGVYDTHG